MRDEKKKEEEKMGEEKTFAERRKQRIMCEAEQIQKRLERIGITWATIDVEDLQQWAQNETDYEVEWDDFVPFTNNSKDRLAKLMAHLRCCYHTRLFDYDVQQEAFVIFGEDLPNSVCGAFYWGQVNEVLIGKLYDFTQEMEAVYNLRENSLRFAKLGVELCFDDSYDKEGELQSVCRFYDRSRQPTATHILNLENHVLLMEWLDEQECIVKMSELLLELQRLDMVLLTFLWF